MTPSEYKLLTRAESAEYESEQLRSKLEQAVLCIAKISYCSAQCGADAMKMRNLAMDYMREHEEERRASTLTRMEPPK